MSAVLDTLIAIGAAHALYLCILVMVKRGKVWADYVLVAYLLVLAEALGNTFFAFAYQMPDLMVFQLNINLLLAPLFFAYIRALTRPDERGIWQVLPHIAVYVLTWIYWLGLFITSSQGQLDLWFSPASDVERPALFSKNVF